MSPAQRAATDRSFERLYRRHRRDVYGFALRAVRDPDEAEDVTQTAFLNAYRALNRGDRPERPRAWLLTIAQNITRRRYRERAAQPREVELDPELPSRGSEWNDLVAREIEGALRRLRPNRRRAVLLRDVEGLSYAEIAERMSLTRPAVETLLFRARKELQSELEKIGRAPSVVPRRRSLRSLFVLPLPGSFLTNLDSIVFGLGRSPLARTAGAVVALVLGAGIATQAGPLADDAAADRRPAATPPARSVVVPEERLPSGLGAEAGAAPAEAVPATAGKKDEEKKPASAGSGSEASGSAQTGGSATASSATVSEAVTTTVADVVETLPVEVPALPLPDVESALEQVPEPESLTDTVLP